MTKHQRVFPLKNVQFKEGESVGGDYLREGPCERGEWKRRGVGKPRSFIGFLIREHNFLLAKVQMFGLSPETKR